MKSYLFYGALLLLAVPLLFSSCKKSESAKPLKVGLVSGIGGLNDNGFNQQAVDGLRRVSAIVPMATEVRASTSAQSMADNIAYFTSSSFDVIITLGYDASQLTLQAAKSYPNIKFLLLDFTFDTLPSNLACVSYQVDQASFPCGFLAAYRATVKDPAGPKAGYVAGPDIPNIRQFTESFAAGVEWFNLRYLKAVEVSGANAVTFTDTLRGAAIADSLITKGADIVFACAGKTGNGALYKAKESSVEAIGVDNDQYYSIPAVGSVLVTSCMKKLNEAVYTELLAVSAGTWHGGRTLISNLSNKGVDLAPYHDFDPKIPDSIRKEIAAIRQGIIDGTIPTGW